MSYDWRHADLDGDDEAWQDGMGAHWEKCDDQTDDQRLQDQDQSLQYNNSLVVPHDEEEQLQTGSRDAEDDAMAELDEGLSPEEVLARIENVVARFVEDSATGNAPTIQVISRSKRNAVYQCRQEGSREGAAAGSDAGSGSGGNAAPQMTLGLKDRTQTRDMVTREASGAFSIARGKLELIIIDCMVNKKHILPMVPVFRILEVCHELVSTGRQTTQRDVYYKVGTAEPLLHCCKSSLHMPASNEPPHACTQC